MLVAEKYHLHRLIGWSDEAEVHAGPPDPTHKVPLAVKLRHGMGGPPRPDGVRERFLRACNDQQAAVLAGCRQIAPVFESGHEGDNAFFVSPHYQRSADSLIQGRVALDPAALRHITDGVLAALEQLRDKHSRAHGNLKPTNIFLDGKSARTATVLLSDLALRETITNGERSDCWALGASVFQLVRGRAIKHFDWPIVPGEDWNKLGPQGSGWREFCNVLMSPETSARQDALAEAREAFKNMRRLGAVAAKRDAGKGTAEGGEGGGSAPRGKGLLVTIGAGLTALAAGGGLLLMPPDTSVGKRLRNVALLAPLLRTVDVNLYPGKIPVGGDTPLIDSPITPGPDEPTTLADVTPSPAPGMETPAPTPEATPVPTPMPTVAEATPLPDDPATKWIGYTSQLETLRRKLRDPAMLDQTEMLTGSLSRFKEDVSFQPVHEEPSVIAFLRKLPAEIKATGDQPDLSAMLWTKESTSREEGLQTVVYQWGKSGFKMPFNRVAPTGGNGPAFYLSALAVPVRLGVALAKAAEADGKGPLSGTTSVKGPVAWEFLGGNYTLRNSWMVMDSINSGYYASAGRPNADSPMNGLSAMEAVRLARAAGCTLPTVAQWNAVLNSPSGKQWTEQWQTAAKVRSAQWSAVAKGIQAQRVTGAKLPNDQCFGDRNDLSPVGQGGGDPGLFFEPVGTHVIGGFANLIGNIGQYVVDDARNPTKYYFAGGSAVAPPSAFQNLSAPPPVVSPFLSAADGGLRLAAPAKGSGSDKNPALDKLNVDLDAELARVQKIK